MFNILSFLKNHRLLLAVLLLGLVVRVIALIQTPVISDDGPLYLHQARAIYIGDWHSARFCGFPYLSLYPFLVIPVFALIGDWILSGQAICFILGMLTLVPVYLICRSFFDEKISALTTAAFAINPVLVEISIDVTKDITAWFFVSWGLYFFIYSHKKNYFPLLSSIFFLLAMLARIETAIFILSSYSYIVFFHKENKLRTIFYFSIPLICIFGLSVPGFIAFNGLNVDLFSGYIYPKIRIYLEGLKNYEFINSGLKRLMQSDVLQEYDYKFVPLFLGQVRETLWFIPIGVILKKIAQAFFIPFLFITLIGMVNLKENIRNKPFYAYFAITTVLSFLAIYFFYLLIWAISKRYNMIFLFTTLPFIGYGITRLLYWFRYNTATKAVGLTLLALIFTVTLVKDLKPERHDKLFLKEIGQYIAAMEGSDNEIPIATSKGILLFYANLDKKNAPCPRPVVDYSEFITMDKQKIKDVMKEHGIKYFIWEEDAWKKAPPFRRAEGWEPVKTWKTKKSGRYRLYRFHSQ